MPFSSSDSVVVGTIIAAQPFLSTDHKMIYTELSVEIASIVKPLPGATISQSTVTLIEQGGSLILPSGRVVTIEFRNGGVQLEVGHRYALFLANIATAGCFRVVKAWALNQGKAWATSPDDLELVRKQQSLYNGMDEAAFLKALGNLAARK